MENKTTTFWSVFVTFDSPGRPGVYISVRANSEESAELQALSIYPDAKTAAVNYGNEG